MTKRTAVLFYKQRFWNNSDKFWWTPIKMESLTEAINIVTANPEFYRIRYTQPDTRVKWENIVSIFNTDVTILACSGTCVHVRNDAGYIDYYCSVCNDPNHWSNK